MFSRREAVVRGVRAINSESRSHAWGFKDGLEDPLANQSAEKSMSTVLSTFRCQALETGNS